MKTLSNIVLLVICLMVLPIISGGCTKIRVTNNPPQDTADPVLEESSSPKKETVKPKPAPEPETTPDPALDEPEVDVLTIEEIKEIVFRAQEAAYSMAVAGFEAELSGEEKKDFSYYEPILRQWYADELLLSLGEFYENYLNEWGFEMGFAFPLHQRELIDDGFSDILEQTPHKIAALFYAEVNYEEVEALVFTLERQSDNRWVVTCMSCCC